MIRLLPFLCLASLAAAEGIAPEPARIERRIALWTAPVATLDLAPEVAGRLAALLPQPGEALPPGPVVRIDPELADLAVVQAEAAVAQAAAELAAAAATRTAREADLRRSADGRAQAERERARFARLRDEQRVSETELDRVGLAAAQAAQAEQAAAADAAAAEASHTAAAARQRTAEAQLATARAQRARHDLAGPAGWIVLARLHEPGAMVAAGIPVLRLADTSRLLLAARLDEAELADLRRLAAAGGVPVRFIGGGAATAAVRRIDVTYDPASRKRLVELVLPGEAAPEASGGLQAELVLAVPDPAGGVTVPASCVQWRIEQPWVRLADGGERPVQVLRRDGGRIVLAAATLPAGARLLPFEP
jgi:multidrug efflux pump subunit AcrA (membrane-fusion protein)